MNFVGLCCREALMSLEATIYLIITWRSVRCREKVVLLWKDKSLHLWNRTKSAKRCGRDDRRC